MTSGANFISDPRAWRVSKSGFSIRVGWSDDKRIIAAYSGPRSPVDNETFRKWFDAAERICDLYNSTLDAPLDCPQCAASKSFFVDPADPAVGFCIAEQTNWRVYNLRCATVGCLREKATFGDHCMRCLEERVSAEV